MNSVCINSNILNLNDFIKTTTSIIDKLSSTIAFDAHTAATI